MDPSSQYRLYQSPPQLPSPSQLQLPSPSFPRNTLPPIGQRYPPPSFPPHPSLAGSPPAGLPPLSPPSAGWHHHPPGPPAAHHHQAPPRAASGGSYARERERDPLPPPQPRARRDSSSSVKREAVHVAPAPPHDPRNDHPSAQPEDGMASTSDFVKKLFKMLDDQSIANVVSWGPTGDCFVVKDMNEFTKSILPRMFKHSNFASFVRQLNKYDFHKVKNNDEGAFGEHSWTFRHPDFHADRPECLENIKRKVPTQRKSGAGGGAPKSASPAPGMGGSLAGVGGDDAARAIAALEAQVERLTAEQEHTALRLREMRDRYEGTIAELVEWQRSMAQTDGIMRNLIQYFLQLENGASAPAPVAASAAMFTPPYTR